MKDYIEQAHRTLPVDKEYYPEKVALSGWVGALRDVIDAGKALDVAKKAIVYGKDIAERSRHSTPGENQMRPEYLDRRTDPVFNALHPEVFHGMLGLVTEASEIAEILIAPNEAEGGLDEVNLMEEMGDLLWYMAITCRALGTDFDALMEMNIAKLKTRYPDKYSHEDALERDLESEAVTLARSADMHPFGGHKHHPYWDTPQDIPDEVVDEYCQLNETIYHDSETGISVKEQPSDVDARQAIWEEQEHIRKELYANTGGTVVAPDDYAARKGWSHKPTPYTTNEPKTEFSDTDSIAQPNGPHGDESPAPVVTITVRPGKIFLYNGDREGAASYYVLNTILDDAEGTTFYHIQRDGSMTGKRVVTLDYMTESDFVLSDLLPQPDPLNFVYDRAEFDSLDPSKSSREQGMT